MLSLSGCGTMLQVAPATRVPEFQEQQLSLCPDTLPTLKEGDAMGELLLVYTQTAEIYHSCKIIHNNLVKTIRELGK